MLASRAGVLERLIDDSAPITTRVTRQPRQSSWMLERLTAATKHHHQAIDEAMLAGLAEPTVVSYRHFLARMYGFAAPLGSALLGVTGLTADFVVPRIRTGYLASDLLGLGLTGAEATMLQRRHEIASFRSAAEALGWLYVSERITLRHELIRARLHAVIPTVLAEANDYLGSTRGRAQTSWQELGSVLDRTASCEIVAGVIVDAAHAAFASQREWLGCTSASERISAVAI